MKTYIYLGAALALLGALIAGGWYIHTSAVNNVRVELLEQHAKNLTRMADATIALQTQKDQSYAQLQSKLRNSDARVKLLTDELRNRPERGTAPITTCPGAASTGAGLYRDDAEFLTWYSAQTQRLVEERDYYYERYEDARKQIERLKNGKD